MTDRLAATGPVETDAFARLLHLSRTGAAPLHLVFDFARQRCLWGEASGRIIKIALTGSPLRMGRSAPLVELPLDKSSISRQHVAFFPTPTSVEAEDLSTLNGTSDGRAAAIGMGNKAT